MLMWLLNFLSKRGVHSPALLQKIIVQNVDKVGNYKFNLYPDDKHFGLFYIQCVEKKGFLADLAISIDFRDGQSFENEPKIKVVAWPKFCRNTYLVANAKMDDPEFRNLVEMIVFGVLPMIAESCRAYLSKTYEQTITERMV